MLSILDEIEQVGDETLTKEDLNDLCNRYANAYQFDRAVRLVLFNYITGVAHGRVKVWVGGGLDEWRKLYNRYVQFAEDLENILIRELIALKPVTEDAAGSLLSVVERVT